MITQRRIKARVSRRTDWIQQRRMIFLIHLLLLATSKHRDIKCFKCQVLGHYASDCLNKRMIIIRRGEVVSESDYGNESNGSNGILLLEDCSNNNEHVEYVVHNGGKKNLPPQTLMSNTHNGAGMGRRFYPCR